MKNKKYKLYQEVLLATDFPEHYLQKGDLATIVEIVEKGDITGYALEIFDNNGDTLKVIIVNESDISEVIPHAVINYRKMLTQ